MAHHSPQTFFASLIRLVLHRVEEYTSSLARYLGPSKAAVPVRVEVELDSAVRRTTL